MKDLSVFLLLTLSAVAASVDGTPLHYSSAGKGRTVILVHGWTCNGTTWSDQVPALATHYRVVTVDLPGHGKSGAPQDGKLSMDLFARAIDAVRAEIQADHVILAGHSMGTPVVIQYARLYPRHAAALVFVDGLVTMPVIGNGAQNAQMWAGEEGRKNRERMVNAMFTPATSTAMQAKIRDMMLGTPESTAVAAMQAMYDPAVWKTDVFDMPVLGLYAEKSRVGNQAFMKEHFPKMEYHELDGTGHFLMLEKPEEFNRLMLEFLDRQKF